MDVSQTEFQLLKVQIESLQKIVEKMSDTVTNVEKILAKQEGQNIALRLFKTEEKIQTLETDRATYSWIPEQLQVHETKLAEFSKFQYKILGIGLVASAVISTLGVALGRLVVDKLF